MPVGALAGGPSAIVAESDRVFWLRADNVTLNGSDVSAWPSLWSPTGAVAQGTPSSQPVYLATGGPNGTPAVQGDGTEWLEDITTEWLAADEDFWTYIVCRLDGSASNTDIVAVTQPGLFRYTTAPNFVFQYGGSGAQATVSSPGAAAWTYGRGRMLLDSIVAVLRDDQAEDTTANSPASPPAMGQVIVGGAASGTFLHEVTVAELICTRPLTSEQHTAIGDYFNNRYGSSLSW